MRSPLLFLFSFYPIDICAKTQDVGELKTQDIKAADTDKKGQNRNIGQREDARSQDMAAAPSSPHGV